MPHTNLCTLCINMINNLIKYVCCLFSFQSIMAIRGFRKNYCIELFYMCLFAPTATVYGVYRLSLIFLIMFKGNIEKYEVVKQIPWHQIISKWIYFVWFSLLLKHLRCIHLSYYEYNSKFQKHNQTKFDIKLNFPG